ncbi:unnamed protein product [Acanthocheilonema viteae]|uniref:Uncharacterized protein n=1 Tax=Acanthocheilonema viteae TaxID=6277 RepID=A0A498SQZ4_ACAVI|nr:unnamed protein product [Acanthocheilonema viteae]
MASKNSATDDTSNISWPLIKYTKLVGARLEIPVASGQVLVIIYNKNRCYLSVMFNSLTLEEFSLALNPRLTMRSREKDVFVQLSSSNGTTLTRFRVKFATLSNHASFVEFISFFVKVLPPSNMSTSSDFSQPLSQGCTEMRSSQESSQLSLFSSDSSQKSMNVTTILPPEPVSDFYPMQNLTIPTSSSASLVDEKVYEVLKPMKCQIRHYSESSETSLASFSQSSSARILNCLQTSKTADQTVPFSTDDMEMAATQPSINLPLAAHFSAVCNKNYEQKNRRSVGIQTEQCLSINDFLNDSSRLEEYLKAKLQDYQFMQLVEKCSQVYDTVFRTVEASSEMFSIKPIIPAKTRRCKK